VERDLWEFVGLLWNLWNVTNGNLFQIKYLISTQ